MSSSRLPSGLRESGLAVRTDTRMCLFVGCLALAVGCVGAVGEAEQDGPPPDPGERAAPTGSARWRSRGARPTGCSATSGHGAGPLHGVRGDRRLAASGA
jgi:hypothetical protein